MTDDPRIGRSPFRVRFDECGPDGLLRTSVLMRYAQDLASHHSALVGIDRAWYAERGIGWLVRAAEVAILAPLRVGDALQGATQAVGFRRVWARRRTEFHDADGALVAWSHIDWVLLDSRGAPTRSGARMATSAARTSQPMPRSAYHARSIPTRAEW